jgi:hypothetical protein
VDVRRRWTGRSGGSPDNPNFLREQLDTAKWVPPPYKNAFRNDIFIFDKPLLIVHNKFTTEWGATPVNTIDLPTLEALLAMVVGHYQVGRVRQGGRIGQGAYWIMEAEKDASEGV